MIVRIVASALLLLATTSGALAQAKKKMPAEKLSPRPVQPEQKQPAPPAKQPQQTGAPLPPMVYSPWVKFCGKDDASADPREACLTMKEARLETGQFLAGAALIEQQDKK